MVEHFVVNDTQKVKVINMKNSIVQKYIIEVNVSKPFFPDDPNVIHFGIATTMDLDTLEDHLVLRMEGWEEFEDDDFILEFDEGQIDLNFILFDAYKVYTLEEFYKNAVQ